MFVSLSAKLSSHLYSATNHKSSQVEAQMLKRPKECLHQQKRMVNYSLGISGIIQPIAFWTNRDVPSNIDQKPEAVLLSPECEKYKKYF